MFLLCKEIDGIIVPRGIFDNRAEAQNQAISGRWLIIPVEKNRLYSQDMADEAMTGAIWKTGSTDDLNTAAQALSDRIDVLIGQFQAYKTSSESAMADMTARISALETA